MPSWRRHLRSQKFGGGARRGEPHAFVAESDQILVRQRRRHCDEGLPVALNRGGNTGSSAAAWYAPGLDKRQRSHRPRQRSGGEHHHHRSGRVTCQAHPFDLRHQRCDVLGGLRTVVLFDVWAAAVTACGRSRDGQAARAETRSQISLSGVAELLLCRGGSRPVQQNDDRSCPPQLVR